MSIRCAAHITVVPATIATGLLMVADPELCMQYTVLTAHTQEQLVIEASPIKWCGLHQILRDPRVCRFKLSPLQNQYLAVEPSKNGGFLPGEPA